MASAIMMALVPTRALLSAGVAMSTMATPVYARLAYLPCAGHALQAELAFAHTICEAVG